MAAEFEECMRLRDAKMYAYRAFVDCRPDFGYEGTPKVEMAEGVEG